MTNPVLSAPLDLITTAFIELVRGTGRTVYDHAYAGDPTSPSYPYHIVYRLAGGSSDETPDFDGDPQTITVTYQVTTVSSLRNQCEQASRVARDRVLGRTPTGWAYPFVLPAGWTCVDRRPDLSLPGIDRSGNPPTAVFSLPARFTLTITPTT